MAGNGMGWGITDEKYQAERAGAVLARPEMDCVGIFISVLDLVSEII